MFTPALTIEPAGSSRLCPLRRSHAWKSDYPACYAARPNLSSAESAAVKLRQLRDGRLRSRAAAKRHLRHDGTVTDRMKLSRGVGPGGRIP